MLSLNMHRLQQLQNEKRIGADYAARLIRRKDYLITLILIGNNLVNIIAASVTTLIALRLYGEAGIAIATFILTLVILICAEIIPKTIAAFRPERIALIASIPLSALMWLLKPLVWIIHKLIGGLFDRLGINPASADGSVVSNLNDLRTILLMSSSKISESHRDMLLSIVDLDKLTVRSVMTPKAEMICIDIDADSKEIYRTMIESPVSRIPLYEGTRDGIFGIIHVRNMPTFTADGTIDREKMKKSLLPPYFIPEQTSLFEQLLHFRNRKIHFGVVVDEYSVVQGVITIEDILEMIIGEFSAEQDAQENEIIVHRNGNVLVDGSTAIYGLNKQFNWDLPLTGAMTINGFILEQLDSFPDAVASIQAGNYRMELLSLSNNVIKQVKITVLPPK